MLGRIILFSAAALFALKLFAPQRLRVVLKQLDRGVNLTLIGLAIVYAVQLTLYFLAH
ncbi:MAG TPA: hypothetical protein VGC79_25185 [Polyangiaceae bacterium]